MFEQAVLSERPSSGRYWAVMIGLAGEILLVSCILTAPLLWPQLLPRVTSFTWLTLPPPVPSVVKTPPPVHVRPTRPWQMVANQLIQPAAIPNKVVIIEDAPLGVSGGPISGVIAGDPAGIATSLLQTIPNAPPARALEPPVAAPPKPVSSGPIRVRQGGLVHPAQLLRRVEPVYPLIARQARISGTVELTGVIGVDGHIRELQVVSGHPLLAKAALDAVRRWVYEPTLLNGEPVEVIAPITVNFRFELEGNYRASMPLAL